MNLVAPYPYFGGKSKAVDLVWSRLGDTQNYCEPFCGSAAMLLGRPTPPKTETVNDIDGLLVNFWRAVKHAPLEVVPWCDYPVTEIDLGARHRWLIANKDRVKTMLENDPEAFDARAAGYWVWGLNAWIGSGWCHKNSNQVPHLGGSGQGIQKVPHLGDSGRGIQRVPHLGGSGQGETPRTAFIREWFLRLSHRLHRVRVVNSGWQKVLTPSVTTKHGMTAIFLDPPYDAGDHVDPYAGSSKGISSEVRAWCLENGSNPLLRIAICGYGDEHAELESQDWVIESWGARKGYGDGDIKNSKRERIWFSPNCLKQNHLFESKP
jgi:hypothetical protein